MTACASERRERVRAAADAIDSLPDIVDVDIVPAPDTRPSWALEIVVEGDVLPSAALAELAEFDIGLVDVTHRGLPVHTFAIARP